MRATGVNVIDSRVRDGKMGLLISKKFPKVPGADLIVNASGKLPFRVGRRSLKPGGRLIEPSPTIPTVIGTKLANPFRGRKHLPLLAFPRRADLDALATMAAENTLRTTIAKTFPLAAMETGGTAGKVVVTV